MEFIQDEVSSCERGAENYMSAGAFCLVVVAFFALCCRSLCGVLNSRVVLTLWRMRCRRRLAQVYRRRRHSLYCSGWFRMVCYRPFRSIKQCYC